MTKQTKTDNVSLKVEQLENRDAPSMPPAVMRRLGDVLPEPQFTITIPGAE